MLNSWEDVKVGTETGKVDFVVTDAMVDDYLAAAEIDGAWLQSFSVNGKRIAPIDLLPKVGMNALFTEYMLANVGRNVRVKQGFKIFAPSYVGMHVRAIGHISDKYEKPGRRFVALEATFTDSDGKPLITDQRVVTVLGENFKMKD